MDLLDSCQTILGQTVTHTVINKTIYDDCIYLYIIGVIIMCSFSFLFMLCTEDSDNVRT